ncbi:hypothetical protein N8I74_03760 [Chitiniphilus purpureus]|uniref:START domain-containing protein n=1 Tax=Chitiniphilus purpureus TaxID=2981137 RepID=A0ABY6DP44_9NEIS|nr:hypothetical protein [Chitiniphilus sp. CD1]UXY16145.1 hypothetical protein N8I74_03760 [Chitiniphilus sp. CD1]
METSIPMTAPATRKRPSLPRRIAKGLLIALVALVLLVVLANWLWLRSGSNRWELAIDENGTQIYTLKSPGTATLKVRGVTQSKEFTLSNHLAPFFDADIQKDCGKWVEGCLDYRIIKPWDAQSGYNVTMWTVALFPPFAPREFLLQGELSQDPRTRVVTLENIAVPNRIEPSDCCVRLNHVHNVWRYTPLGDGTIKIEFISDFDMGDAFPKLLLSLGAPSAIHKMLTEENPRLLRQPKYRAARIDFIDEGLTVAAK